MPSACRKPRSWRMGADPFERDWADIEAFLPRNPGVQAKAVFEWLQGEHVGQYRDGQLRTLQRRFRRWRLESRARAGAVLRAGVAARSAVPVRLHAHDQPGRDLPGAGVRAHRGMA